MVLGGQGYLVIGDYGRWYLHQNYLTRKDAEIAIFEYIKTFYNTKRRHQQLNNLTIIEYHKTIYNNLKNVA